LPGAGNPNRFHEERSEIAADIAKLARRLAPRRLDQRDIDVELSEESRGRIGGFETLNGAREYAREEDLKAWDIFHGNLLIERHELELHCIV
jgi:hypothetical protein